MNSREKILAAVKRNKPELTELPKTELFDREDVDLLAHFKEVLEAIGGRLEEVALGTSLEEAIINVYPDMSEICSVIPDLNLGKIDLNEVDDPHALKGVELAIIKGEFGVAENSSIWVTEEGMGHRSLPFITQHLVIVLEKDSFVWNMHQAYDRINIRETGFGTFIAGPSKTADIEQSLVIGAHGPRSLSVFLV